MTDRKWLLRRPDPNAAARLFCMPYSGCGASMYHRWPRWIGDIEICPVQLPGRENRMREPAYDTYEALAADLIEGLRPLLDGPFAFFGHCAAALPCFEVAAQLSEGAGPLPARLFVSSQVAPAEGPYGRFLDLDDAQLTTEMETLIRQQGAQPLPAFVELGVRVLRADVEANRRYRQTTVRPLHCAVTAIGWSDDVEVAPDFMKGWAAHGPTDFHTLAGPHYQFLQAPPALQEVISAGLATTRHQHHDSRSENDK